ncbi:MAG: spermidine synthase [Candidatus Nanohaloarchaea archaeon]
MISKILRKLRTRRDDKFPGEILFKDLSQSPPIRITDKGDRLVLYLGSTVSGYHGKNESIRPKYLDFLQIPLLAESKNNPLLLIGGGAYNLSRYIVNTYDLAVDVVEVDQQIEDLAKEYFQLQEKEKLRTHISDGRAFLTNSSRKYSGVIVDAFQNNSVPYNLQTREFAELVYDKTDENGFLAINTVSSENGFGTSQHSKIYSTFNSVFPYTYCFSTLKGHVSPLVIIGSKKKLGLESIKLGEKVDITKNEIIESQNSPKPAQILKDGSLKEKISCIIGPIIFKLSLLKTKLN